MTYEQNLAVRGATVRSSKGSGARYAMEFASQIVPAEPCATPRGVARH